MLIAGRTYRDLRAAFGRGAYDQIVRDGPAVAATLEADATQRELVPATALLVGAALAEQELYTDAIAWLEHGLARLPGTASVAEVAGGHWYHRLLADLYLLTGRWDSASGYLDWLARPEQPLDSRLAATRGQAMLAATRGRFDDAHLLVNAAADLARRAHSSALAAMVEADRALVVAAQGRLLEAVRFTEEVAPRLAAPGRAPEQRWANAVAAALLTTMARLLAAAGDLMTAMRYLIEAGVPVVATGRSYWSAQLDLARGVVWREEGEAERAEPAAIRAVQEFDRLGARPAAAVARLEEARLAEARGHVLSARRLYERAWRECAALGLSRETSGIRARLATLRQETDESSESGAVE